jgi:hypothetical protein
MARASNKAVNRLPGSAHGSLTVRTPCSGQLLRGGSAFRIVHNWQGVQMTPAPSRLMIIERTGSPAFRTRPLRSHAMNQMNIHFALLQIEFDPVHLPRLPNP